jgi:SAM-dependent methyltransferase
MLHDYFFIARALFQGKSIIRATLNKRLMNETLSGSILDLGSGGSDRYSGMIPRTQDSSYALFDIKKGMAIDFEKDALPYESGTYDVVILLNVLEHLYNTRTILLEIKRIKKEKGTFIAYVPFLMWYHPDHHDFFRYTHEALLRMFTDAGFEHTNIEPIYRGPYTAAFQMIHPTLPIFLRPFLYFPSWILDAVFLKLRKKAAERYVLGYYIKAV